MFCTCSLTSVLLWLGSAASGTMRRVPCQSSLQFYNGFCLQSDRSASDAGRTGEHKLTRIPPRGRAAVGLGERGDRPGVGFIAVGLNPTASSRRLIRRPRRWQNPPRNRRPCFSPRDHDVPRSSDGSLGKVVRQRFVWIFRPHCAWPAPSGDRGKGRIVA
jgi:hypothetical protein